MKIPLPSLDVNKAMPKKYAGRPVGKGSLEFIEGKTRGYNQSCQDHASLALEIDVEELAKSLYTKISNQEGFANDWNGLSYSEQCYYEAIVRAILSSLPKMAKIVRVG